MAIRLENSAIGVALTDLNARYLVTNHVYQTILGYTEEELRALDFLASRMRTTAKPTGALITELVEGKRRQFSDREKVSAQGTAVWFG